MKRVLYLAVSLFFVTSFMSCEKDMETKGISRLTYYADIQMKGKSDITLNQGDTYTELGAVVLENGKPIDYTTSVTSLYFGHSGSVNTNIADVYLVTYTAVNTDGYSASKTRAVTVLPHTGDFVTSLEGWYSANVTRTPSQGTVPANKDLNYIMVSKLGANKYGISCGIGGYYAIGRGYGDTYLATVTTFTADIAGDVYTPGPSSILGTFGGSVTMSNIVVDKVAKTIKFTAAWPDGPYTFNVTLKQVVL